MINACPLYETYLLPYGLFCQPISYVSVSLTLLLFFPFSYWAHQSTYDLLLCSSMSFISTWRASSIAKSITSCYAIPVYASIFAIFLKIPAKVDSEFPRALLINPPPPSYELHSIDPLKVGSVPFECCIAGLTRMVLVLLKNMKRKIMVAEAFVFFFPVTLEINGGS